MSFYSTFKALDKIEKTQGTNAKKALLNRVDNDLKCAFQFLFENNIITGIREKKWDKIEAGGVAKFACCYTIIEYFQDNHTGKDIDVAAVKGTFKSLLKKEGVSKADEDFYFECAKKFVTKTWNIGIDAKSINSVFPGLVKTFEVQLAEKYWDHIDDVIGKDFAINQKLDGYCTIIIKRNGKVELWSRSGKQIEGFTEIEKAAKALKEDNFILHGERMPIGFQTMNSKDQFKLAQESTKKGEKTGYCIAVYDWLPIKDWDKQFSTIHYSERYATYTKMLAGNKYLVALPNLYTGNDTKQIKIELDRARAAGKEGVMVKLLDGIYRFERSSEILKVKVFEDADCKILDVLEGNGRLKGKAGSFLMKHPEGFEFQCGSGLTDEIRNSALKNKKAWVGKVAEIIYFERTQDKSGKPSVRFPVFKVLKGIE